MKAMKRVAFVPVVMAALASVVLYLSPATSQTTKEQVNTDSAQTLTNKIYSNPQFSGTVTGSYSLNSPTIASPTFSGTATGTYTLGGTPTLQSPILAGNVTGGYTLVSPILSGTATLTGSLTAGTFNNPTINSPNFGGTAGGTYTLAGTPTITAPTLTGLLALTGGQIQFPSIQQASSNANTLDDYEEGPWTPSVGGSASYVVQDGHYVKIGKVVHLSMYLHVNSIGTGNTSQIGGIPFPVSSAWNNPNAAATVGYYAGLSKSVVQLKALVNSAGSPIFILYNQTAAATSLASDAVIGNGTVLIIQATYETTN